MDADGGNCFPAIAAEPDGNGHKALDLVDVTGLTSTCIKKHLQLARVGGWITIHSAGRTRQGWRRQRYEPQIPPAVLDALTRRSESETGQLRMFDALPLDDRMGAGAGQPGAPAPPEGGQPRLPRRAGGGQRSSPPPAGRGQREDETRATSEAEAVNHVARTTAGTTSPPAEEAAPTAAVADDEEAMADEITPAAAVARMWAYLDGHPIRAAFAEEVKWTTFRYAQRGIIEGTDTGVWWSDRRARRHNGDGAIRAWADRVELWEQAVDAYGEELGRPDRRPNEKVMPIRDLLFRIVIPRRYDPFKQRVADEAE
ncbi:MAG TPA: hypothetical protein VFR37_07950, partial [Longimicrobium sp.]|nr:hypothetical protein [Longimicrobium sp.]